jgi:hypothetical protein
MLDGYVHILEHKELVKALNSMFKKIEDNPDDENVSHDLYRIIFETNLLSKFEDHKPKVESLRRDTVKFDKPFYATKGREPKLIISEKKKSNLKTINGGLHKPAETRTGKKGDDALTMEFKDFMKNKHP